MGKTVDDAIESDSSVECAVRAEQVRVLPAEGATGEFENTFQGVVDQQIFEGDRMVYQIRCPELGDAAIFSFDHDPTHSRFHQRNEAVTIGWNAKDVFVYASSHGYNQ